MAERLDITLTADVTDGFEVTEAITQAPEGVLTVSYTIGAGISNKAVTGLVRALTGLTMFAIKADVYQEASVNVLTWKAHSSGNPGIVLDQMQVLTGGALALLPGQLDIIYLTNTGAVAHTVTFMIAGDLTA